MIYDLIIIGGGPAGLFAAGSLNNKKILLLEKQNQLGKKLLISGAGQCNFTKAEEAKAFIEHFGDKRSFVKGALGKFKPSDSIKLFESLGVAVEIQENNKVFPKSRKAEDILDALLRRIKDRHIIKMGQSVKTIKKTEDTFFVETNESTFKSKAVLIATGGTSFGHTGSTGDGYKFAKMMGHNIITPRPALMPVYVNDFILSDLSGIGFTDSKIIHYRDKKLGVYKGELLITHRGLSGPVVLNNGRYIEKGDKLFIKFNDDPVEKILAEAIEEHGKLPLSFVLNQLSYPARLIDLILKICNIDKSKKLAEMSKKDKKLLIDKLTSFEVSVDAIGGLKTAMATKGGVDLAEVNKNTCESKLVKGLYFAGEVLDVDGDTGGYNIHFAFATANLVGMAANKV